MALDKHDKLPFSGIIPIVTLPVLAVIVSYLSQCYSEMFVLLAHDDLAFAF